MEMTSETKAKKQATEIKGKRKLLFTDARNQIINFEPAAMHINTEKRKMKTYNSK